MEVYSTTVANFTVNPTKTFNGVYVDHETFNGNDRQLAKLSSLYKNGVPFDHKLGISLLTCHRVEFYCHNTLPPILASYHSKDFLPLSGHGKVLERFLEISLGLRSKIIGETTIFFQVARSIQNHLYYCNSCISFQRVLMEAKKIRDKHEFYAPNHGQLVYEHIKSNESRTLILFGAGILNQSLIHDGCFPRDYSRVYLISRNPRRAKKELSGSLTITEVLNPSQVKKIVLAKAFDLFVATERVSHDYADVIHELLERGVCKNLIDLSSSPIPGLEKFGRQYFTLFSHNTTKLVDINNRLMEPRRLEVLALIKNLPPNWFLR